MIFWLSPSPWSFVFGIRAWMGRGEGAMIHASPDFFEKKGTSWDFQTILLFFWFEKDRIFNGK